MHDDLLVVFGYWVPEPNVIEFGDTRRRHHHLSLRENKEAAVKALDDDLSLGVKLALVNEVRIGFQLACFHLSYLQ